MPASVSGKVPFNVKIVFQMYFILHFIEKINIHSNLIKRKNYLKKRLSVPNRTTISIVFKNSNKISIFMFFSFSLNFVLLLLFLNLFFNQLHAQNNFAYFLATMKYYFSFSVCIPFHKLPMHVNNNLATTKWLKWLLHFTFIDKCQLKYVCMSS